MGKELDDFNLTIPIRNLRFGSFLQLQASYLPAAQLRGKSLGRLKLKGWPFFPLALAGCLTQGSVIPITGRRIVPALAQIRNLAISFIRALGHTCTLDGLREVSGHPPPEPDAPRDSSRGMKYRRVPKEW